MVIKKYYTISVTVYRQNFYRISKSGGRVHGKGLQRNLLRSPNALVDDGKVKIAVASDQFYLGRNHAAHEVLIVDVELVKLPLTLPDTYASINFLNYI